MHPAMKILAECWGLTEKQLNDISAGKTVQLRVGCAFGNEDKHTTEIRATHLILALKRLKPEDVMELFIWAALAADAKTAKTRAAADEKELERTLGDAAGEGMGTARPTS